MSVKTRSGLILAAVLLLSAAVWSVVAAQDATATVEPPSTSATAEPQSTAEPMTTAEPSGSAQEHPFLGVALQDSADGAQVTQVLSGSAAEDAGLQVGDVITAVNGTSVSAVTDVSSTIAAMHVGDQVTLDVTRGGSSMTITATLGTQQAQQSGEVNPAQPGRGNRGGMMRGLGLSYNSQDQSWTITSLDENSPLYTAGLREGDVITGINGQAYDPAALVQYLGTLSPDEKVTLNVTRDGAKQDVEVTASDLTMLMGPGMLGFDRGQLGRDFPQLMPMFQYAYGNGRLGVTFQTIDAQVAQQNNLTVTDGALITAVDASSPAADAGLQVNDVVTAVNGELVDQERTLRDRLIAYEPGDKVTLTVLRGGASQDIDVTLGEQPTPEMSNMFPNGFPFRGPGGGFFNNPPEQNEPQEQPTEQAAPNT